jgi:hypothetical protein
MTKLNYEHESRSKIVEQEKSQSTMTSFNVTNMPVLSSRDQIFRKEALNHYIKRSAQEGRCLKVSNIDNKFFYWLLITLIACSLVFLGLLIPQI